jgi:di/tricarboxylate transporter
MILYLFITLMTNILANNATALLMSPIVISIALQMDIDPHALLLTVILAASTSFFTPVGYHTLTLIYGPGKYRFKDYLIAGLPLTIIIWIVASLLINYHYITLAGV